MSTSRPETIKQIEAHTAQIRATHDALKAELAAIDRATCNDCHGSGRVKHDDFNPTQARCPHCDGEGSV